MLTVIEESPLHLLVTPRSIAFFGASNNPMAMGTSLLLSVRELGYQGALYPIHPTEQEVQGLPAFQTLDALPEIPDLGVIVLPTRLVIETVRACGERGLKRLIVISAGFKETGPDGARLEAELREVARQHDIRFLGPNCIGVANPHHRLNTTFMPHEGEPGFIGMASQSGSFITQMFNLLARHHLGFSVAFSVGNEANIDLVDCLEYLGTCPHTRVVALYVEGITRGREFVRIARQVAQRKPIVAYYVGGSEAGRRAGHSHTGALAGPDPLYDGIFRQAGVIRARSVSELFDFCQTLGCLPAPAGPRVTVLTHSGGPGASAADACNRAGLALASLSESTRAGLAPHVPHTASMANPVDLTYTKNPLDYYNDIPRILISDPQTDLLLMYILLSDRSVRRMLELMQLPPDNISEQAPQIIDEQAAALARTMTEAKKPLIGFTFRDPADRILVELARLGVPVFADAERAARAAAALWRYQELKAKIERCLEEERDATVADPDEND